MSVILADTLTRIRNGQIANLESVAVKSSKFVKSVMAVLKAQGYIRDFVEFSEGVAQFMRVELAYYNGVPVISKIKTISRPGYRVYTPIKQLKKSHNGLGIKIISTPKGVMTDAEARHHRVGGEVLCEIF